jgi:3-deoxy-manno-octulosonate cytidylyltransferase (CMP-KDO synthetase)
MVIGVIPARYGSTRFPGKALARIHGKPLVQWVWERARGCKRLEQLWVATDDERIAEAVRRFGGDVAMTSKDLPSGTDRVWEVARRTSAKIVVNIQGDEPLVTTQMVDVLVEGIQREPKAEMATLRYAVKGQLGYNDPNVVKVVCDADGWALYFSRAPIPHFKNRGGMWYKHLGLYAYRRSFLERFVQWPPSFLELAEGLEQLRALERGAKIKVMDSPTDTIGVDTPEELARVEEILKEYA